MQDEEIRDALREAREPDRESAPSFGTTWAAAEERKPGRGRRIAVGAAVAAAAVVVAMVVWPDTAGDPTLDNDTGQGAITRTEPQPDIPANDDPSVTDDDWSTPTLADAPSDFLLEENGSLAGDLPSDSLLDESAFEFDDPSLREL